MTTVFLLDGVIPWITRQIQPSLSRQHALTAVLLILAVLGGNIMTLYASSAVTDYGGSNSMPSFIDKQDYTAMQWTRQNVDQSSEFLVIGDAAEWFPYLANRTNVVGPWGVEWERSPVAYQWQYTAYQRLSTTRSITDLNQKIALTSTAPDYIYVPRGTYTVYGREYHQRQSLMTELYRSDEYRRIYRNRGVVIFERTTNSSK